MTNKIESLSNFYLIELRNEAIASIFKNSYNLNFFAIASDDFKSDIEVINASDFAIEEIINKIDCDKITKNIEFNPLFFPHLPDEFKMVEDDEGNVDNIHPYTAKRTIISLFEQPIITARSITSNNQNINQIQ